MSSPLVSCLPIGTHRIQRDDASRVLIVDCLLVRFTPTEYRLLMPLLQGYPLSDLDLVRSAFSCDLDSCVRENLDKHIDKIRSKLRPSGLNIYRVAKYGYVLLAESV